MNPLIPTHIKVQQPCHKGLLSVDTTWHSINNQTQKQIIKIYQDC